MLDSNHKKGYFFSILATLTGSLVYILSKAALKEVSLPQFGVYWFLMGIIWNSSFVFINKKDKFLPEYSKKNIKTLILLGFIEIIATTSLYAAISVTTDASIPSFLRNLEFIFVALLGVFLLKERFSFVELTGVFLTIGGAIIISYYKDMTLKAYLTGTTGLMLLSSVSYAIRTIIAKKHIKDITPSMLALNRALFICIFSFVILQAMNYSLLISLSAFIYIALGAFFGPFLTSLSQYSSLKYMEASKGAIIQSTTPLFVVLGSYFYFSKIPLEYQIFGGILTIIGTVILIIGKDIVKKK